MRGNKSPEKAKNFQQSLKRLLGELKGYKLLIIISLIFAMLGSILAIFAPNKLSDLTDEISKGLVINVDNLELLTNEIYENIGSEENKVKIMKVLDININEEDINKIMNSKNISEEDKSVFNDALINKDFVKMPISIFEQILKDSKYENNPITAEEKLDLIKLMKQEKEGILSTNIANILLNDIEVENEKISKEDQIEFINIMSDSNTSDNKEIYKSLGNAPESIQNLIKPSMNFDRIKAIFIFLVVLYVISGILTYVESIMMTDVANKFARNLRNKISTKINKLPLKYFDLHENGDVLSRITNDVDTISQSMNHSLSTLVSATTLFLGSTFMMFYTNGIMAITAILSSLLGFSFMFIILSKSQKYFEQRQKELGNLNGHIEEVYSGISIIKAYNAEEEVSEEFDKLNNNVYDANRKSQFLSGLMSPMMGFIGNFGYVMVCIVGALLAMNDHISFGVIVAFIMYVRLFSSPLSQIAQSFSSLQSTAAASERVFEFVDEEEMSNESNLKKELNKDQVKGKIEFKNVLFKYDGNEEPTIKDFSAIAHPGEKIAIVGPTGAGKTTIINLLMKFYDINSGDILIDDHSLKDLTRENIHELFTMVLQDTWLFEGTFKENIRYNLDNVTDEEIENVCKTVGIHHFIKSLPNGYNTIIQENDSVSAGQRQLITIARGMLKKCPFLILDEATSNVDTRTEALVQEAMDKLMKGKTSFIIAHRLSTIKNADLILVMKDGNIIETGNHDELMKLNGFYTDLYNSQFNEKSNNYLNNIS